MIDEILRIADNVQTQRDRIDRAANNIITTTPEFRQYEQAVESLDAAIADLKSASVHVQSAQADKIIWALGSARMTYRKNRLTRKMKSKRWLT